MIAVAATAVGIPFNIEMPGLNDWYPNSVGWVLVVFAVGFVIAVVATLGYTTVVQFANLCAPWMLLVFVAAVIATLPALGVSDWSSFLEAAQTKIWTGVPMEGQSKFTFWHILFFAWCCNMAMHLGMADMSVLRYAKKWQSGFASSAGMFLGHFLAWMSSGILCAAALGEVAPGPIAYQSVGIAGIVCVIIAGWTTSNPTIYRAGLAFQNIFPKAKRWKVTLITGAITTLFACFPALVMKLLDFVALYGLVLVPMGAIIFIDFYVLKWLKLKEEWAAHTQKTFYIVPAITWGFALLFSLFLNFYFQIEIFFLGLPAWLVASLLYISLSWYVQKKTQRSKIAA